MASTAPLARLLIVDDEAAHMKALCHTLEAEGYLTTGYTSAAQALASLREHASDLVLTDLMMPEMDGIAFLRAARDIDPALIGIVMTGHGAIDTAVQAMQAGALDYILKPFRLAAILPVLSRALAVRRLQEENIQLRESVAIHELHMAMSHELDLGAVLQKTVDAAFRHSDATDVCILLKTTDGNSLRVASARGELVEPSMDRLVPLNEAILSWVACARVELSKPDGWNEPHWLFKHPFRDLVDGIALPMIARNELMSVLIFRAERRLRAGQIKGLSMLASAAAAALAASRLLQELRSVNEGLEQRVFERTRELEAANRDLESFSYSVSHDLRAPLRAVQGFCEIYMTDYGSSIPADGRPYLERVCTSAQRMGRLIDDLLAFARFGREPLTKRTVPVGSIARRVLDELLAKEPHRRVEMRTGELPDCQGDASLLEQVFVNLLSNALKFTRAREKGVIEIGGSETDLEINYFIRDNGAGFDMRYADKLFGVFQRLHTSSEFDGTGVGLSIVQRVIQRHGGKVWATGEVDKGATFHFSLPR